MGFEIIAVSVLIIVVAIGVLIFKEKRKPRNNGKYPEGHWMGVGMALGMAFGMPLGIILGIAMDNISVGITLGPSFGVGFGVALGTSLEKKHKKDIRPLTAKEKKARKWAKILGFVTIGLGLLVLLSLVILRKFL